MESFSFFNLKVQTPSKRDLFRLPKKMQASPLTNSNIIQKKCGKKPEQEQQVMIAPKLGKRTFAQLVKEAAEEGGAALTVELSVP